MSVGCTGDTRGVIRGGHRYAGSPDSGDPVVQVLFSTETAESCSITIALEVVGYNFAHQ